MKAAVPNPTEADEARIDAILTLAAGHWPALQEIALEYALAGRSVDEYAVDALALRCWSYSATRRVLEAAASAASVSLERISTP